MALVEQLKSVFWWLPFGQVAEINAGELNERLAAAGPMQIVDVRSRTEWRRSHIPGAVNVPIQELKGRITSLELDASQPIIAICLSAHRSIPAVRLLQSRGFPTAVQLEGGMLAWWKGSYPTVNADQQQ